MSALGGLGALSRSAPPPRTPAPALAPGAQAYGIRLATLTALSLFGMSHWARMVSPSAGGDLFAMLVVALLTAMVLPSLLEIHPRVLRVVASAALMVTALWLVLRASGVPADALRPHHWDRLVNGVWGGLQSLPTLRIPYRGTDEWIRAVLLAGGGLLLTAAALLALVPEQPRLHGAALCLGALYIIAIVERSPGAPYLDGAVFAVLLGLFLWGERLEHRDAGLAVGLALVAIVAALVAAPKVDAVRPWIDYEKLAESLQPGKTTAFTWNHDYGPITWGREGLEVARVRSGAELYWKTATLEDFLGNSWRQARGMAALTDDTEVAPGRPNWFHDITVSIRGLRSTQFLGAGTTFEITDSTKRVRRVTPGTFRTIDRQLRRGDTYNARVYVPRPGEQQLHRAGDRYPPFLARQLRMELPPPAGDHRGPTQIGRVEVSFAPWGTDAAPLASGQFGFAILDAERVLRASPYGDVYALAQRLKAGSRDPYDFVRNVEARVQRDARYTETPPSPGRDVPLHAFLFRDHAGYCQHFSGAMALLLRMGGVPARVATGFSPGVKPSGSKDFVVRDIDAHSWVEVYFPHLGWVTYDPTPPASPARSQLDDAGTAKASAPPNRAPDLGGGDRQSDPAAGGTAAAGGSASPWVPVGIGAGVLALLGAGALVLLRRRRSALGDEPELEELRRALARCGRAPTPDMTLNRLERLLSGSDGAQGYLRALRLGRYGHDAGPPTAAQRRALRRELAAGLGLPGRLRAMSALPPRPREVIEALRRGRRRRYVG